MLFRRFNFNHMAARAIACERRLEQPRGLVERGFTLLELVMVMTIIVILAAVSIASYQKIQLKARETILKDSLRVMRRAIDQYQADKEKLPQSIEDLVNAGYIREVPIDPITGRDDWDIEIGEDLISLDGGQGMVDVHSSAQGEGSDGVPYSDY